MIFTVIGKPQGKARPRFDGRRGIIYTPKNTSDYEKQIRRTYIAAGGCMLSETAPIKVTIIAQYLKAKSSRKVQPTLKPDWDNVGKAVCDALNGIAYKDDSQIIQAEVYKIWALDGVPKVVVKIEVAEDGNI